MAQAFLEVGASLGPVNLEKERLLPSRETVRASVTKIAERLHSKVQEELSRQPSIAVTTDHWTDEYTSRSYQSVTAHYIDTAREKWVKRNRVLAMKEVKGSHTGNYLFE